VLFSKYFWGDQVKKVEMGRVCGMYVRNEKCIQNFSQNLKGRDHLGDIGVGGRVILDPL
jgi:hypothetical protein